VVVVVTRRRRRRKKKEMMIMMTMMVVAMIMMCVPIHQRRAASSVRRSVRESGVRPRRRLLVVLLVFLSSVRRGALPRRGRIRHHDNDCGEPEGERAMTGGRLGNARGSDVSKGRECWLVRQGRIVRTAGSDLELLGSDRTEREAAAARPLSTVLERFLRRHSLARGGVTVNGPRAAKFGVSACSPPVVVLIPRSPVWRGSRE
jgi:hypothetical protein